MNILKSVNVHDILLKYYGYDEWIIVEVVGITGSGNQTRVEQDAVVVSDMKVKEWREVIQHNPDMKYFYMVSYPVESGKIISIKDNLHNNIVKSIAQEGIKKILEGNA